MRRSLIIGLDIATVGVKAQRARVRVVDPPVIALPHLHGQGHVVANKLVTELKP